MKASEALAHIPTNLEQSQNFGRMLLEEIHNGELNPLDLVHLEKHFAKAIEYIKKELTVAARIEAEKYGKDAFTYKGMQIQLAENGIKYDYAGCGDPVYAGLKSMADETEGFLKEREQFLRNLKEPLEIIDHDTGETYKIYPPKKTSTSGIKCEIK